MDRYCLCCIKVDNLYERDEETGWNDGQWLFPKAVRLLEIPTYRRQVLHGLVLSIGSKTEGTVCISFPS